MESCKLVILIFVFLLHLRKVRMENINIFAVEYPDTIFPYSEFTISIRIPNNSPGPVDMAVAIDWGTAGEVASEPFTVEPGGHVTIPFHTEDIAAMSGTLRIVGEVLGRQQVVTDILPTGSTPMTVIVKTDKLVYKPGDTIYILYAVLDGFLRPMGKDFKPDLLLQSSEKTYEVDTSTLDSSGFSNSLFVLPLDCSLGEWTASAHMKDKHMKKFAHFQVTADGEEVSKNKQEEIQKYMQELEKISIQLNTKDENGKISGDFKTLNKTIKNLHTKVHQMFISKGDPQNEIENLKFQLSRKNERISLLEKDLANIINERDSSFLMKGLLNEGKSTIEEQVVDYIQKTLKLKDITIKQVKSLSSKYSVHATARVKVDKPETIAKIREAQKLLPKERSITIEDDSDYSCEQECDHLFSQTKRGYRSKLKARKGKFVPKQKKDGSVEKENPSPIEKENPGPTEKENPSPLENDNLETEAPIDSTIS